MKHRYLWQIVRTMAFTVVVVASGTPSAGAADPLRVETTTGPIRGVDNATITAYLGIPYAEPPVGKLRWRPPQPRHPWRSELDATKFGKYCMQGKPDSDQSKASEHCLSLNVFVPKKASQRPVMVWIHGGANEGGASQYYDPTPLVETGDGVIVVTINYRLGAFGFLSHPALDAEGHAAVNYGILDQQLALKWVRANIGRFGGDARNVTIFGESAGGLNVTTHLVSPLSKGLFDRAIIQSGGYQLDTPTLAVSQALGTAFAERAGCKDQSAACLRALSAADVLMHAKLGSAYHQSTVDGKILVESQRAALVAGRINRVPVMVGVNRDEGLGHLLWTPPLPTPAEHEKNLESSARKLGKDPARALALYSLEHYSTPVEAAGAASGDRGFACGAQMSGQWLSKWTPTYAYEFADAAAGAFGATHGAELKYLFNMSFDFAADSNFREWIVAFSGGPDTLPVASQRLAQAMRLSWVQFAATGNPQSASIPHWPLAAEGIQFLTPSFSRVITQSKFESRHHCAFWN
jgi:para-nitrobenzyl esterase